MRVCVRLSVCVYVCLSVCLPACLQVWMYVKVSGMNIYIWPLEFGQVHEILVNCT